MKARLSLLALALVLVGCASRSATDITQIPDPDYAEHRIQVQTLPAGALIDWNNDVIGTSPCEIVIPLSFRGHWPRTGYYRETLRARWSDGTLQEQLFVNNSQAPRRVAFIHPNPALHHPQPVTLTQVHR